MHHLERPFVATHETIKVHQARHIVGGHHFGPGLNVIGNAIDATEENEQGAVLVELSLDTERDLVRIAVIDNGSGIKPEDIGKIFSVFESRKGSRGTGLGLPVSQKILLEHSGEIQVTSQEGKGTTFALVWPAGSTRASMDGSASPTIA